MSFFRIPSIKLNRVWEVFLLGVVVVILFGAPTSFGAGKSPQSDSRNHASHSGRLFITPEGSIDSRGVPTLNDVWEFIQEHPEKAVDLMQDTGQWSYLTVAGGIIACHDAVIASGGRPIPQHLRKFLRRWYPDELLDTVRWIGVREPIRQMLDQTLDNARMRFFEDTLAVTVMNAVIFRTDELAGDGALWAHELFHVEQFRKWGVFGFARKWSDNPSVSGPVEAPAYAREAEARRSLAP